MNTQITDLTNVATTRIRDDESIADKKRFESFKLGGGVPPHAPASNRRLSHSRSHSRNSSVSPSPSLSFSLSSNSMNELPSFPSTNSSHSTSSSNGGQRNSHHRRRSSVSTRRESAEMMGVSLPDLPTSLSEDNINFGDKDSVRRRALWALEGKPGPDVFSPVEIPELDTPEIERRIYELPSKPSYPPGIGGGFGSGLSGLSNKREKRESFGKHIVSSSVKDQLHTLVEEEEEEEEEQVFSSSPVTPTPVTIESPTNVDPFPVTVSVTTPSPGRHRPLGLNLRPLSLVSSPLAAAVQGDLPTPTPTPSPKPSGLKSLTLASSPSLISSPSLNDNFATNTSTTAMRRQSIIVPPIAVAPSTALSRRSSLSARTDSLSSVSSDGQDLPKRRSSISYKPSSHALQYVNGLPTPELTPTTEHRNSTSSESDWGRNSLSTSEHHFLYQSQAALVARITDLERALSSRSRTRPDSCASDVSASTQSTGANVASEPSDEMLQLIADLKEERDELKKDVDGWRVRVADLEKQTGTLARRVDQERREAWVSRERLGLLEVEKRAALKNAEEKEAFAQKTLVRCEALQVEYAAIKAEYDVLKDAVQRGKEVEEEVVRLKAELAEEKKRREELERELEGAGLLATPTPEAFVYNAATAPFARRRGVMSIDSESSCTDVESVDEAFGKTGLELKAVAEEDEEIQDPYSEDNGLAGYEDEEEFDEAYGTSSSFGSLDSLPRSNSHLNLEFPDEAALVTPSESRSTTPAAHERHASLSKAWSFPMKGSQPVVSVERSPEEIDRFFGCLEDLEDTPPKSFMTAEGQSPFSKGFFGAEGDDEDELPPFVLPPDVGVEVPEPEVEVHAESVHGLDVLVEEDEPEEEVSIAMNADDEFIGEEVDGGIRFTFTIPPEFDSPASMESLKTPSPSISPTLKKMVPFYEAFMSEDEDSFSFSQPDFGDDLKAVTLPLAPSISKKVVQAPASPSSIPRASSLKKFETPTKLPSPRFSPLADSPSSFVTPPTKRGGSRPSFLPQPRKQSPSPSKAPIMAKPIMATPPTFLPQPQRKSPSSSFQAGVVSNVGNGVLSQPRSLLSMSNRHSVVPQPTQPFLDPLSSSPDDVEPASLTTTPPAARLSFQSFANFIPMSSFPWSPRSGAKAAAAAAMCMIPASASTSTNASVDERTGSASTSASQQFMPMFFGNGKKPREEKRGFVSKERQLERLRSRMEEEWRTKTGEIKSDLPCKKCVDEPLAM
ncbi:hypothetical protein BV25DRAFT_1791191 [Artomyces pyxidatus]|uniref:Uncharacterized protein n=1 Tax=Artomyces pyxidatus TaxID=48021 RepID=A0ACB8TL88_9AGAM|nr:hypothetical protein BV25DRAFT_1791191 [Artomyces pyxidatus]